MEIKGRLFQNIYILKKVKFIQSMTEVKRTMYDYYEEQEITTSDEDDIFEGHGRGYYRKTRKPKSKGDQMYKQAFDEKDIEEKELIYDDIGKTSKPIMSVLNKAKISDEELNDLLNH
jgi:hypothetical protein